MVCELCERDKDLEFHHLIPRTNHSNSWFKKRFSMKEMRSRGIDICYDCHLAIHKFYKAKQLGREFNTKEKLMSDEKIMKAVNYNKKQK